MLGENYNSEIIRRHYFDRHEQALAFLLTIGAKALVLQTQREQQMLSSVSIDNEESVSSAHPSAHLHTRTDTHTDRHTDRHTHLSDPTPSLEEEVLCAPRERESVRTQDSLSLWSSEVSGMNDEAETRLRIVHQERLRSLRRKLLEKKPVLVYKRGRNHKMRLIELVIQHDRQRETYVMWRSKMNTLKKVEIDCNTLVDLLPHQRIEEDEASDPPFPLSQGNKRDRRVSLSPLEEDAQSSRSYTQPQTHSHTHILAQLVRSSSTALPRNDSDASLSGSSTKRLLTGHQQSSSAAPAVSIASHNIFTQHLTPWLHDNKSQQKSQNNDVFATHSYASTKSKTSSTRSHNHYYTQRYLSHAYSSFHKQKPVPFLRLKSKTRSLELQFLTHVELEAFLLVLRKSAELSFELDGSLLPENTILPVQSKPVS